jgi:hypothetical protein
MTIRNELIDELLAGQDPASVMRQDGLLGELKKALLNRLMAAEFDQYAAIAPLWRRQWDQVIPFFAFPPEVRRIIYTTNAIESLNSTLRTAVRSRGHRGQTPASHGVGMQTTDWCTVAASKKLKPSRLSFKPAWQSVAGKCILPKPKSSIARMVSAKGDTRMSRLTSWDTNSGREGSEAL